MFLYVFYFFLQNITAAAYQSFIERESCYRLHDGETAPIWALIDSADPTKGVQMTYTNGDWCEAGGVELTLDFSSFFYYVRVLLSQTTFSTILFFSMILFCFVLCVKPLFSPCFFFSC